MNENFPENGSVFIAEKSVREQSWSFMPRLGSIQEMYPVELWVITGGILTYLDTMYNWPRKSCWHACLGKWKRSLMPRLQAVVRPLADWFVVKIADFTSELQDNLIIATQF